MQTAEASVRNSAQRQQGEKEDVVVTMVDGKGENIDKGKDAYVNFQIRLGDSNLGKKAGGRSVQFDDRNGQGMESLVTPIDGRSLKISVVNRDMAGQNTHLKDTLDEHSKSQSSGSQDGTPLTDDDQHDEHKYVAQAIYRWVQCQKPTAEELTRRHRFDDVRLKGLALSMARALDSQCKTSGVESMDGNAAWSSHSVSLLALFWLGNPTWNMGVNLWGPGKGMIEDLVKQDMAAALTRGFVEFDGKVVPIQPRQESTSPRSATKHHRDHRYKLFGRTSRPSSPSVPQPSVDGQLSGQEPMAIGEKS